MADDIQVGELDGDGEMEIVIKREPYDGANQGDGIMVLLYWKPINWMELSFGVLTWELIFVRALIILLIYCTI